MIRRTVKLKPTKAQERQLEAWLWHLTGVYNWAIRKIELDARQGIYHKKVDFLNLLAGTSPKLGIPSQIIQGTLLQAYEAWERCFRKQTRRPRLKGQRNKLTSIHFPDRTKIPGPGVLVVRGFPRKAPLRYKQQHAQKKHDPLRRCMIDQLPKDALRGARILKAVSGWYCSIVVDQAPAAIPQVGQGAVGIDPGYAHLLTLSTGEKIEHPRELQRGAERYAQAQRGGNKRLAARLQERQANRRLDRNHKLSRRLVAEHQLIAMSKDRLRGLARAGFGKSVAAAGHGQLASMLAYKSTHSGRRYVEVASQNSTRTCSCCGALTGPQGRAGLSVRAWTCAECGSAHDRDVNAAVNTLKTGAGQALEPTSPAVPSSTQAKRGLRRPKCTVDGSNQP
jgi:transposase